MKDLKSQIEKEKTGNNPEIERLKKSKEEYATKIEPLLKELKEVRDFCKGAEEIKRLKAERSTLTNELEIHDIEDFNDEIRRIQKKLGFGNLNAGEEKKLIDKKNKLDSQKNKIQKLNEVKSKIVELGKQYGPSLKKIGDLSKVVNELIQKKKEISDKLKKVKEEKRANDPEIKNLQFQRESIRGEIDKLNNQIADIEQEWNDKWYKYEQQQKILDYIKEATNKINMLKKKAERDKKRKEKMEKKGKGEDVEEDNSNADTPKEKVHFAYEISSCEWMINYFKDLIGEGKSIENDSDKSKEPLSSQSKINDELKSGSLKVLNRDDKFPTVDSSLGFKNKKKMKKENQNKKANNFLVLDISLINRVKEVGLTPPVFADAVKPFVGELENKMNFYREEAKKLQGNQENNLEAVKFIFIF